MIELCAPTLLRLLARTWRLERSGAAGERLLRSSRPWIVAMWHGRMLTLMPIEGHCRRDIGVLVSPSDDGGLAKLALDRFRYRVVRGSLNRRGARAMREMHTLLTKGGQLVITPDGPRGPRHTINSGPAWLARATGAPLLLVGVAVDRAWRLSSWDRMTIPKPFARVLVHYDEPIVIPADCDDDRLERRSADVRERLLACERAAFARLGVPDDHEADATPNERDPGIRERTPGS
ncbi:MAG TPA: DUF374 domain-containing protein [bacterium]|nr:DUF374 domain-containing protein [bacterium]